MADMFDKGRWYQRRKGKPFQLVEMRYIDEKDGRWWEHFEFKAADGECISQDIDFISGEGLHLKNGWEACDPPTQKKGIDRFEAGKWYRYTGTREDAPFSHLPTMSAVLDNKPHKCISGRDGITAIFDCTPSLVPWNWYNFDNWEEVPAPEEEEGTREKYVIPASAQAKILRDALTWFGVRTEKTKIDRVKSFIASL